MVCIKPQGTLNLGELTKSNSKLAAKSGDEFEIRVEIFELSNDIVPNICPGTLAFNQAAWKETDWTIGDAIYAGPAGTGTTYSEWGDRTIYPIQGTHQWVGKGAVKIGWFAPEIPAAGAGMLHIYITKKDSDKQLAQMTYDGGQATLSEPNKK